MARIATRLLSVAGIAFGLALAGCAASTPVGSKVSATYVEQLKARVTSVDHARRQMVLQTADGQIGLFTVGPNAGDFAHVAVGDTVRFDYLSRLSVTVLGSGAPPQGILVSEGVAAAPDGTRPAGVWALKTKRAVTIVSVDRASHTVTYRDVDGVVDSLVVQDPANYAFAEGLRPGTVLQVSRTDAIAASIHEVAP